MFPESSPIAFGGDGFTVPSNAGNIRGITHETQLDASLGQGRLLVGTIKSIYALQVPVSRTDWIGATNANQPLQTVVSTANGWVNDRSIVHVNSDIFFQSLEPAVRSYISGLRYFGTWGNTPRQRQRTACDWTGRPQPAALRLWRVFRQSTDSDSITDSN